jgi:signal transduction histidine kinase
MANSMPGALSEVPAKPGFSPRAKPTAESSDSRSQSQPLPDGRPQEIDPRGTTLEEREITRRLRAQYAEISQLAGGLAHEIRNPLSTLSLNLDLLAEDFQHPDTPRDRRVLQRVERLRHEVDRLWGLVENFLRFACVGDLKLECTDLNAVIDELRDFYEPQATTQGIVIRTHFAPDLPPILLDGNLFKQALLNLVLNAQHAMPTGGDLILTTRREASDVVIDVIDTGAGMTEEVRAKIFDAFFSTRSGGSGLGLPTTRKIVEAHRGFIQVQSELGKGSQFTIRLPFRGEESPATCPQSQDGPVPSQTLGQG